MSEWKVGDELAFNHGYGRCEIIKIDRILPSGRIVCGRYTLNPNLKIRGADKWGPFRAVPVTETIRKNVVRRRCLDAVQACRFEKLSDASLAAIVEIIRNDEKQETDQ